MVSMRVVAWGLAGCLLAAPAAGRELAGAAFEEEVQAGGQTLRLKGLGLREKYFFDVFVLGVYTGDEGCDPAAMVATDRVKMLRLRFLRDVPASRLAAETRKVTADQVPGSMKGPDRPQAEEFIRQMTVDVARGTAIDMVYVPGQGTTVSKDGKPLGPPLAGKAFQEVLWASYLGRDSFCPKTRDQVLGMCRGR